MAGRARLLAVLGVPAERRGIVLLCGYIAAAAFGLIALLTPPGDPIGWAYLGVAVVGYFFIQTRGLTVFLWLLVALGGVAIASSGAVSGWVQLGLGLALAVVGLTPTSNRIKPAPERTTRDVASPNGDSSSFLEVSVRAGSEAPESDRVEQPARISAQRLVVHTFGRLQLLSDDIDLAAPLEKRRVLAFLFKYLLARAALHEAQVTRSEMAEELSPNFPESNRLERLRKQLYDLQHDLPEPLTRLIQSNPTHVWLDIEAVDSDVGELAAVARRVRERGSLVDASLADEIRRVLERTEQEFLPGFEDLEEKVNQAAGSAGDTVRRARQLIAEQRVELIRALADYEDAIGRPEAAIAYLRPALEAMPERQDLARLLVVAYLKTGQTARAAEVRRGFDVKE